MRRITPGILAGCVAAMVVVTGALSAERVLMRHGSLVARVSDGWCAAEGTIYVDAADPAAFAGDRLELQRLVGGLRAILPLECPRLQGLRIIGRVNGQPVQILQAAAQTGWQLQVAGGPPQATAGPAAKPPLPGSPPVSFGTVRDLGRDREAVAEVQRRLAELGYDPGPADGIPGARTRAAIEAFQRDRGLPVDSRVTDALLATLRQPFGPPPGPAVAARPQPELPTAGTPPSAAPGPPEGTTAPPALPPQEVAGVGAQFVVPPPRPRLPHEPDACDLLAADPWDPDRVAEGVEIEEIDGVLALEACTKALEQLALPRFAYQRARALLALERYREAEQVLEELSKAGHVPAGFELARLQIVRKGSKDGAELLKQTASAGHPPAQAFLARLRYLGGRHHGINWNQDGNEAARLAQSAATAGHPDAAFLLAELYERGVGVPVVTREALRWYRVAAEKGNEEALKRYARFDPAGAEALRARLESSREARNRTIAEARARAITMLEQERPRIVLSPRWPEDVIGAIEELRWAVADKIRTDVGTVAASWRDLAHPVAAPESLALARFWWALAGADFTEAGAAGSGGERASGLQLIRELTGLYETDEDKRQALELLLWGIGEVRSPVPPPAWATPEAPATGAATIAQIVDNRLAELAERVRSARVEAGLRVEEIQQRIEEFRDLVARSASELLGAGENEATPALGNVAAFGSIREAVASAATDGAIRVFTETSEARIDDVQGAVVTQGFANGGGQLVGPTGMAVPMPSGAALQSPETIAIPAADFGPVTARAFPAILALELGSLRWAVERVAVSVERAAGITEVRPWRPEPTGPAVVASREREGSASVLILPSAGGARAAATTQMAGERPGPGPEEAEGHRTARETIAATSGAPVAPAAEQSAPEEGTGPGETTVAALPPAAPAEPQASAGPKLRLDLVDGSSVVAELVGGDVRFRSLFGEVQLPFGRLESFRDGLLTLSDGTAVKGEFTAGSLRMRTALGEVSIEAVNVRGIERVTE